MKADEQQAESHTARDAFDVLADQFRQDGGYLPPQGDQSWREREALGIVAAYEDSTADATADEDSIQQEYARDSDSIGRGHAGMVFALFVVAVIAVVIVAFASPGILTAGFWRAHWSAANLTAKSAVAPASVADAPAPAPAPLAQRAAPPQSQPALAQPTLAASPGLNTTPVANAAPDTNTMPEAAPKPSLRPAVPPTRRDAAGDHGTGGFYAMVAGPDGTLEYKYFPSKPSR